MCVLQEILYIGRYEINFGLTHSHRFVLAIYTLSSVKKNLRDITRLGFEPMTFAILEQLTTRVAMGFFSPQTRESTE